ncbi:unnamed protein product [Musa banksii]
MRSPLREGSMRMVLISGNSLTSFDQLKLDRELRNLHLGFSNFSIPCSRTKVEFLSPNNHLDLGETVLSFLALCTKCRLLN